MNNFIGLDTRNRRNLNTTFPPIHVPVSNYSTKAQTKECMHDTYNTMFLNNLHLIPDPLKKNLADSVITEKDIRMTKTKEYIMPKEVEKPPSSQTSDFYPRLRNIISGVINVMGAMFQWRDSSPASQYYDCFEGDYIENSDEPMSGSVPWQSASCDVQNKNGWAQSIFDDNNETNWSSDMMSNCSPALTDDQINQVCLLLNGESNYIQIPNSKSKPFESGSVDEFEDAFCPDELSLSADSYLGYQNPFCYQEELLNSYASNVKTKLNKENIDTELVKDISPKPDNSDSAVILEPIKGNRSNSVVFLNPVTEMSPKEERSDSVVLSDPVTEMSPKEERSDSVVNLDPVTQMSLKEERNGSVVLSDPVTEISPKEERSDSVVNLDPVTQMSLKEERNGSVVLSDPVTEISPKEERSDSVVLMGPVTDISPKEERSDSVVLKGQVTEMSPNPGKCEIAVNPEIDNVLSLAHSKINNIIEKPALFPVASSVFDPSESSTKTEMVREDFSKPEKSEIISTIKDSVVSSCEDKLNRLKALLKPKCSKQKEIENDYKIICTDNKTDNIVCDTIFGDEISIPSTACLRLAEPFNEVTGKFYSSSVESDDSFQIVFTDDAKESRCRIPSECESEDSFIVFEESPDSCYISDDVFGNVQINHYSDSETSDSEDDSRCESRLCPDLSRTVEDLTDCKLYDEVDSSTILGQHLYNCCGTLKLQNEDIKKSKDRSRKKVHFSSEPPKVHVMRVWAFAARQARIGDWEQHARDRERFKSRTNDVEMAISWVLKPQHRRLVMFQRFMPWWNAQKRKEQEDNKQRELDHQMKQQQEEQKVESKEEKVELDKNENIRDEIKTENSLTEQVQLTKQEQLNETLTEDKELKDIEKIEMTENIESTSGETTETDEELQAEDKKKLDIDEKKAPDRANSHRHTGMELDDNIQFGDELHITNSCDDVSSNDSAPRDPSLESDR